ncbi:MAG: ABC transporter permease [Clostridia bacterium]|nr:ABC transporter permease [Clostridia bacterium]
MRTFSALTRRNIKLFFRDKGLFFTSLITPMILLVLYSTFLANIYEQSFLSAMPSGMTISDKLLGGLVGGQLISSLLSVSCVTVAFCSNMLMVQDKISGAKSDFSVTPVSSAALSVSYFTASFLSTLIICLIAAGAGFLYLSSVGWYLSASDIISIIADILLLTMFGTLLSSIINLFLSSQGQISAVGSIVSSVYGFICGAYMPISQFGEGLQKILSFLPGTYATSLFRRHAMGGAIAELRKIGIPSDVIEGMKDAFDCNIYFFDDIVSESGMYIILGGTVLILLVVFIILGVFNAKKKQR